MVATLILQFLQRRSKGYANSAKQSNMPKLGTLFVIFILKTTLTAQYVQTTDIYYFKNGKETKYELSLNDPDPGAGAGAGAGGGTSTATAAAAISNNTAHMIPIDMYKEFHRFANMKDFIRSNVEQEYTEDSTKPTVERSLLRKPKPANCMPTDTIVSLRPYNTRLAPNEYFYPECTRVKRCSGCCTSSLLSCEPTEIEELNFNVTRLVESQNTQKWRISNSEIVVIEQHKNCTCGCRTKSTDCNIYQNYQGDICRCACKNNQAREKCLNQQEAGKIWDEATCKCVCSEVQSCTTETIFDNRSCKCVETNNLQSPA